MTDAASESGEAKLEASGADRGKIIGPRGIILGWWARSLKRDAGSRAKALSVRLRRAGEIETLLQPEVQLLADQLGLRNGPKLFRLAATLAEVEAHTPIYLPRLLGGPEPVMSLVRFKRILEADDANLAPALRRAVKSAGGSCNVAQLGSDILFWGDEVRRRWTFDYHRAAPPSGADTGENS